MKIIAAIFLLLFLTGISYSQKKCSCQSAKPDETTYFGGNQIITVIESKPFRAVQGIARDVNGEPLSGALIEIFDNPEWILREDTSERRKQRRRIAVCKTNADGSFCFTNIKAGTYELRGSFNEGFNPTHMYIKIMPKNLKAGKQIDLEITPGT